jgi:predicted NBD/HSP70 family sugar kinase
MTSKDHALTKSAAPGAARGGAAETGPPPVGLTLAADIGGTHMRAAVIGDNGQVLCREVQATPHHTQVPGALSDLVRSVAAQRTGGAPSHAVVGLPGPVDYRAGKLLWAPHLPAAWPDQLSERQLADDVGLPVRLANDADVAAVGEAYFGAGRNHRDVAYLTISTGIGAGLVFAGRLVRGDRSLAELGHTIIDRRAWQANLPATLEELASGSGLTRLAEAAGLGPLDGHAIEAHAQTGDLAATRIWDAAIVAATIGVMNLAMAFAPHIVVVGGGLGLRPDFFDRLSAMVDRRAPPHLPAFCLAVAALGDDAGLVGAARWDSALASNRHPDPHPTADGIN